MHPREDDRPAREVLVSVDVETSGPSPSVASLLAVGACLVDDPSEAIYLELRPEPERGWDDAAAAVHGLDRDRLEREGLTSSEAMARLVAWLDAVAAGARPVFVGLNAGFDWMFVADALWRTVGRNPFGIAPLDLKSLYMGRDRVGSWARTSRADMVRRYPVERPHTHNALDDARSQAELARRLLGEPI
ncbi:MAG: 3'-5' exonuclease [Candidatus Limnocylindrales bacterium]